MFPALAFFLCAGLGVAKVYAYIFGAGVDRVIEYNKPYVPTQYSITASASNCTASSSNPSTIIENGTATLTFTANDGYDLYSFGIG